MDDNAIWFAENCLNHLRCFEHLGAIPSDETAVPLVEFGGPSNSPHGGSHDNMLKMPTLTMKHGLARRVVEKWTVFPWMYLLIDMG